MDLPEVRRFEVPRSSKALTVANIAFHPFGLVLATQWGTLLSSRKVYASNVMARKVAR
jgi:hypothetical protein